MTSGKFTATQPSRAKFIIAGQSLAIAALAVWLYMEYLHNPFMREYVSNVWASIWPETTIGLSALVIGVISLTVYRQKNNRLLGSERSGGVSTGAVKKSGDLGSLDTCPFCNVLLKHLSGNRFQCRQCRRYFKSNVPE